MKPYPKQREILAALHQYPNTLIYGASRAGKTFIEVAYIVARCLQYPGIENLICRRYARDVRVSIFQGTIPEVLRAFDLHPGVDFEVNVVDMLIRFPNVAKIRCDGLDDQARVDKILGTQYSTIFVNEAQDVPYLTIEKLMTRLSQDVGASRKFFCDLNPGSSNHWTYRQFFELLDPITGEALDPSAYGKIQALASDNEGLTEDYLLRLASLKGNQRKRFFEGQYQSTSELTVFSPKTYFVWRDFELWVNDRWQDVKIIGGIDLGFSDADSIAIVAYMEDRPETWLIYEYKGRGNTTEELAKQIRLAMDYCRAQLPQSYYRVTTPQMAMEQRTLTPDGHAPINRQLTFHVDSGGGGRKSYQDLVSVYGLPVQPAYKRDKAIGIKLLIDEVNTGSLRIIRGGEFDQECGKIVWTRGDDGRIIQEIDDKSYHPDLMDAVLYPFRFLWTYVKGLKK